MATLQKPLLTITHDHKKKTAAVRVSGKIRFTEHEVSEMKKGVNFRLKCTIFGEDKALNPYDFTSYPPDEALFVLPSKTYPDASPNLEESYKFDVVLGDEVLNEDAGVDEVYAKIAIVNLYTEVAKTKNSNVVSHRFPSS